jgi:putative flippase GtrA
LAADSVETRRRMTSPPPVADATARPRAAVTWYENLTARWPLVARLVKFGSVGGVAYVIDVTIFNVLLYVGAPPVLEGKPLVAKVISTFIATVVAWLGNRYWTFSTRRTDRPGREFLLFATSCTAGVAIALVPLWISHYVLGFTSPLADNVAANVVGLALGTTFRFVAYSVIVFPGERRQQRDADLSVASPDSMSDSAATR